MSTSMTEKTFTTSLPKTFATFAQCVVVDKYHRILELYF
jgi:hypothetical protein